ncbi:uncharacterized protein LOC119712370 [Motacilla alba alba]|uniref:uncharacterized protein LOC119712370 n=1 Tax=Motacilla alba alba TaxID=1094192 RepID=UPI0018D5299F|nr:uncharacterized protein LOC119712370 [Motacilla alba alba]
MRPPTSSDSFSSRLLGQVLQLRLVKYPLKLLQKASVWVGLVLPVGAIRSRLCPPSQSPSRPGLLARKRRGKLLRLLLSVTPTRVQNFLGYLPTDWGQSNMSKEIQEAPINPASKASKRKRDDVALEQQESWFVVLERDLPEDDPEDLSYEPSELESDSDEYQTHNDTELELEEQGGLTVLELSAVQGSVSPPEPGAEDPAVTSRGGDAPDVASGDAQKPRGDGSSEQETDTACGTSSSQGGWTT